MQYYTVDDNKQRMNKETIPEIHRGDNCIGVVESWSKILSVFVCVYNGVLFFLQSCVIVLRNDEMHFSPLVAP